MLSAGVAALVAAAWLPRGLGRKLRRFPYATGPLSEAEFQALGSKPGWSTAVSEVEPGVQLRWLRRAPKAPAPWLLFFHGNDPAQLESGQKLLESLAAEHDWGLAVVAQRGFSGSGGTPSPDALGRDAGQAYRELSKLAGEQPIHVLAFSLGAFSAAHATKTGAALNRPPASLTLLAGISAIEMYKEGLAARFTRGDVYDVMPLLGAVPGPALVVQGEQDTSIGVEQGRELAAALGKKAKHRELPGVGHNDIVTNAEALTLVREWL